MAGVSLFVYGNECRVFVNGGHIRGGTHAISVREGAFLECQSLVIISVEEVGAEVRGGHSKLIFDRCTVSKQYFPENHMAAVGLHVHDGAEALVYRSELECCRGSSVYVEGGYCLLDYTLMRNSRYPLFAKGESSRVFFDNSAMQSNTNRYRAAEGASVNGHLLYERG